MIYNLTHLRFTFYLCTNPLIALCFDWTCASDFFDALHQCPRFRFAYLGFIMDWTFGVRYIYDYHLSDISYLIFDIYHPRVAFIRFALGSWACRRAFYPELCSLWLSANFCQSLLYFFSFIYNLIFDISYFLLLKSYSSNLHLSFQF